MARKRPPAKERMIEAARALFQRQGYHGTGLKQILEQSGAPRGSLYFHFPGGKEELAAAALCQPDTDLLARYGISDPLAGPPDILAQVVRTLCAELEASDFQQGCPVATVALEAAPFSDRLQSACQGHYERSLGFLQQLFSAQGSSADQARQRALFVLAALQGALVLAKSFRSTEPLRSVGATLARLWE